MGPLISGGFAHSSASWRWIFWINLPFCVLGLIFVTIFLKLHREPVPLRQNLVQVDYVGCALFVSSLPSFLIQLTWGGVMYSWSSWNTLVSLILGVAGLVSFSFYGAMIASQPPAPIVIFNNRTVAVNYVGCFLHGVILWSVVYYLPLYCEGVLGYSPVIAGVAVFTDVSR